MSYFTERETEFAEFSKDENYGTTVAFNGLTAICLSTSAANRRQMQQTNFQPDVSSRFDILRTEFIRLGLQLQSIFQSPAQDGVSYQLSTYNDDPQEPVIQFGGILVK